MDASDAVSVGSGGQNSELNVHTQRNKPMLAIDNYLFHCNKRYTPKNGGQTVLYWQCERRVEARCPVTAKTDIDGNILKAPTDVHTHSASTGRVEGLSVRHTLLVDSERRPEAAPAALLNDHVTPAVVSALGSETALKQAIRRRRRKLHPTDPATADDVLISGAWTQTLEGEDWFLGECCVGDDKGYIFATKKNLEKLTVCIQNGCIFKAIWLHDAGISRLCFPPLCIRDLA